MKADALMDAMGMIDDGFVLEARRDGERRRTPPAWRRGLLAAAVALCLLLSVPAMAAAGVDPAYEMLYAVSPALALGLRPVRMACEDKGIRMEVISARIHGDSADVYISLRDLTGDRIDETTDLFDSYHIDRSFDGSATCQLVGYDDEERAATFLIHMTRWDEKPIEGGRLTFTVRRFLSGKEHFTDVPLQLEPASAARTPETRTGVNIRGWSQPKGERLDVESIPVLAEQKTLACSPVPGVEITGMGYVDGTLHIQAYYDNIGETDNHGYPYLCSPAGEALAPECSIAFWDDAMRGSYEEYIFPVPPEGLEGYQVYGNFWTCDTMTEGRWQVTFPLENE